MNMNLNYNQTPTKTQLINDLQEKYFDLVSLTRKHDEDFKHPAVNAMFDRLMQECPEEIDNLSGDESKWHHGFNSGMLACLRLIGTGRMTMQKIVEFPELDT